ncbi:MAG: potassium transporter TrkG, partial [Pseudomonadota bacterium]
STQDDSIGHFNSETIELTAITFMILGSIPFILFVQAFRGKPWKILQNSQVQVFLALLVCFTFVAWSLHPASETAPRNSLLEAAFSVTSIMTGTGYATADYGQWAVGANAFFFAIMFIGGCAGSTSCGIKIFRFQILFETVRQHLSRIFYPNGIFVMRFNKAPVGDDVSVAVMNFFAIYFLLFGIFAILLNMTGLDFLTSMSAAGTAISNVGPGLGEIIGPSGNFQELSDTAKWIMSTAMLVGRLELFTVLVLFMPRFWRG